MSDQDDIQKKRLLLNAFRALERNRAFMEEILPLFTSAHRAHLQGLAKRHATPAERAEFVEAYHFTLQICGDGLGQPDLVSKRIQELETELMEADESMAPALEGLG